MNYEKLVQECDYWLPPPPKPHSDRNLILPVFTIPLGLVLLLTGLPTAIGASMVFFGLIRLIMAIVKDLDKEDNLREKALHKLAKEMELKTNHVSTPGIH